MENSRGQWILVDIFRGWIFIDIFYEFSRKFFVHENYTRKFTKNVHENSPKNVHENNPTGGILIDKNVYENSPKVSTRIHSFCPQKIAFYVHENPATRCYGTSHLWHLIVNWQTVWDWERMLFGSYQYNISWLCFDVSWCCIENYHNFERNEDRATVFLKWTDFSNFLEDGAKVKNFLRLSLL